MYETKIEEWAAGLLEFIFGIIGDIISFGVTMLLMYGVAYVIGRYLICRNNADEWAEFAGHIRSGIKDLAEAFKNAMPAVKESAKAWADEKIEDLKDELEYW